MDSSSHARLDQPCAACRMLHRKCGCDCSLAPYFPAHEPEKFAGVHRVFGASNVIKMLQIVNETEREDAVKSLVYEAHTRLRDPVYGCTGIISYLQEYVKELEVQLQMTRTQVQETQEQRDRLLNVLLDVPETNPLYPIGSTFLSENGVFRDEPMELSIDRCQIF